MELGFAVPVSGSWATPPAIADIARRAEALGYRSLWTFQRLLAPLDGDEHRLDPQYRSVQDPLAVLAYLAAVTRTARLGVAVINAPYLAPVVLAKSLTTIDHLSEGRLDVGIGGGWLREEFEAVGASYQHRGARVEEYVALLQELWTAEVVDHDGTFYRVPRARVDPKPVQQPHPPVLLGATAEPALRRAGRIAAGWISSSRADLESIGRSIDVVRAAAVDAGRDPEGLRFVCRAVVQVRDDTRAPLVGSLPDIADDLRRLEAAGVTEAFIDLNFDPRIGSPEADPAVSLRRAHQVLEALAPGR